MFQVDRKQQVAILIIAAVLLFTAGYRVSRWQGEHYREPGQAGSVVQAAGNDADREIVVHVAGAVEKPGVYRFTRETRVGEALEKAVPLAQADIQGLNLAAILKDQQKLVVPLKDQGSGAAPAVSNGDGAASGRKSTAGGADKVNINRAGAGELEALPGIGPALAGRIISHRETKGLFTSEEDIKSVPGIGEKLYDQIKDYITVN